MKFNNNQLEILMQLVENHITDCEFFDEDEEYVESVNNIVEIIKELLEE